MLNKKTKALMRSVYNHAVEKDGVCLVSQIDLLEDMPSKLRFYRDDLEPSLRSLMLEGYFEIVESEKKGERYYCITLMQAGYDFSRIIAQEKRAIKFKIALTIGGVILSFILSRIISSIFK